MTFWQRVFEQHPPELLLGQGLKIVGIIVGALIVNFLASRALRRVESRAQAVESMRVVEARRAVTTVGLARSIVRWAIFLVAAVMILREVGINPTPIIAGAGIVGLAVGFGAQTLVRDVVSGFFMILEGQLAVGDQAEVNGIYGVVDEIGLRATRMVVPGGQVRYFSNGTIANIVRYPAGSAPYLVSVPAAPDRVTETREAVMHILTDFDAQRKLFAGSPHPRDVLDLPTYGKVMRFVVAVLPGRKAAFEAAAAPRISTLLAERGLPVPQGREIIVQTDVSAADELPPGGAD
ncbi:MAG: mechanosensitive ion channel [Armatimonadota bacterium]|nr:MAG: mechanosensitive ion channel [Armatimonadota bacterium]